MRTALVGQPMLRFDAPRLVGPPPEAGRMVEVVEARGKHLQVMWDDGLVLETHLKGASAWHVYRHGLPWRRATSHLRAAIHTREFVAVCFDAPLVETYRQPDRSRHPGFGPLGPDLARADADLALVAELLVSHPPPDALLRDALVDQHVMRGIGNVYRSEVLWATGFSPWAHVGDLRGHDVDLLVATAARLVRGNLERVRRPATGRSGSGLAVYGRTGQGCLRCHDTIRARPVPPGGRTLFWCPGCQIRLDRRQPTDVREMDPHPAAAIYLQDLPWRERDDTDPTPLGSVGVGDPLLHRDGPAA